MMGKLEQVRIGLISALTEGSAVVVLIGVAAFIATVTWNNSTTISADRERFVDREQLGAINQRLTVIEATAIDGDKLADSLRANREELGQLRVRVGEVHDAQVEQRLILVQQGEKMIEIKKLLETR